MKCKICLWSLLAFWSLFLLSGCDNDDDVEKVKEFTFSQNNVIVNSEAQQLTILVTNAEDLREWEIRHVTVVDNNNQKKVYELPERPEDFQFGTEWPDKIQKEWFDITKKDMKTVCIGVTQNTGSERKLELYIDNGYDYGTFYLTQKAGNNEKAN